jgi:hypothetical protein
MSESVNAVEKIVADLTNRRGLRQEWNQIPPEIQEEIKSDWADIIDKET